MSKKGTEKELVRLQQFQDDNSIVTVSLIAYDMTRTRTAAYNCRTRKRRNAHFMSIRQVLLRRGT